VIAEKLANERTIVSRLWVEAVVNAKECEKRAEECLEMMSSATGVSKNTLKELAENWLILADQARLQEHQAAPKREQRKEV
jgi:hypothetical protein